MALFGKQKIVSCAICGKETKGGFFRGLFQKSIDDQYVCDECYGSVDLPKGMLKQMDVPAFRGYMAFREENQKLREQFQVTNKVSFGKYDTNFLFDMSNRLLCLDKDLKTTIFEGCNIRSFVIKEDDTPIFEGSIQGLSRHDTKVRDYVIAMIPQIERQRMQMQMYRERMNRLSEEQRKEEIKNRPNFNLREPFQKFNVSIYFDHPYWDEYTADMYGPSFNSNYPSADGYLNSYNSDFAIMEELANALMELAFSGTTQKIENTAGPGAAAPVDAVEEIKRYKELMDSGILTEEEFTAKKRQLLGL